MAVQHPLIVTLHYACVTCFRDLPITRNLAGSTAVYLRLLLLSHIMPVQNYASSTSQNINEILFLTAGKDTETHSRKD